MRGARARRSTSRARWAGQALVLAMLLTGIVAITLDDPGTPAYASAGAAGDRDRADRPASRSEARTSLDGQDAEDGDAEAADSRIRVEESRTKAITIAIDGEYREVLTAQTTVRDLLRELGVVLGEEDEVSVELDAPLTQGLAVIVGRAETLLSTVEEPLPYDTTEVPEPSLPKGQRVVRSPGVAGVSVTTYSVRTVGGIEAGRTPITQVVTTPAVAEEVLVGTAEIPDPSVAIADPGSARAIAHGMVLDRGWGSEQYQCLDSLWTRESNWNVTAQNRSSGAYGIPQALPGTKMARVGADWRTNAATQITWGLGYISGRYGTPCDAWGAFLAKGWY